MQLESHYLRVVRALALAGAVSTAGCASAVEPTSAADVAAGTDARADTAIVPASDARADVAAVADVAADVADVADASPCPATSPAEDTPCTVPNLVCEYPPECTEWRRCNASTLRWQSICDVGPLPPPDLPA